MCCILRVYHNILVYLGICGTTVTCNINISCHYIKLQWNSKPWKLVDVESVNSFSTSTQILLIVVLTFFILSIVGNVRQKILFLYHTQQPQCFFHVVQAPHKCIAVHLVMKLPLYVPKTMKFKVPSVDKVTKRFVKGLINHLKDCHCNVC